MKIRLIHRLDRFLRGGDHRPFDELGFPAVRFTEPKENFRFQHQDVRVEDGVSYGDLPDRVDFAYVARVARVNTATAVSLALAPPAPRRCGIDVSGLMNDTVLFWPEVDDPEIAGYRILARRTHRPDWHVVHDVGRVHEARIPRSKDDFLFALQAIGKGGHPSRAVFAAPARRGRRR